MRVVKIEWIDSSASSLNWMFMDELPEDITPIRIISYGVVVKENDTFIAIAQNYGFNPAQCCSLMTIPKGCIEKITDIEEI